MGTAHNPQTDGQTERTNRTMEDMLRCFLMTHHRPTDWETALATLQFCYNDTVHSSTGYSPFFLMYGAHPRTPIQLLRADKPTATASQETDDYMLEIHQAFIRARQAIQAAQDRQEKYYNRKHRQWQIHRGDLVMLSTSHLRPTGPAAELPAKLRPKYIGPFRVMDDVTKTAVRLNLPTTMNKVHPVFHVNLLKPYRFRPGGDVAVTDVIYHGEIHAFEPAEDTQPEPTQLSDSEYDAEEIIGLTHEKKGRKRRRAYLVRYKVAPLTSEWEWEENLHCTEKNPAVSRPL